MPTLLLLLAACAHHVPPVPDTLPAHARESAERLRSAVQDLSDAPSNLRRLRVVRERAVVDGLPHVSEPIDWFSFQKNVLIELPGERDDLVYVVAHYDKTDINPFKAVSLLVNGLLDELVGLTFLSEGAVDNATGVAVALEVARTLAERDRSYTYRVLLVGSEESGLRGSRAHVARLTRDERARIALTVNVDAVGADWTDNCVQTNVSDPGWTERIFDVAESRGLPLERGFMPPIGASDYAAFRRTGPLRDIGRGLLFNVPGGLLPQRSWFVGRHEGTVLSLGGCQLLDLGDLVASTVLVPTGRIHGPRDHAGRVDPVRVWEAYAVVMALFEELEGE